MEVVRNQAKDAVVDSDPRIITKTSDDQVFPLTWYAVMWARKLTKIPIKHTVVGRDLVFYRDEQGGVHCLEAYCAHRGADLSLGHCQNGALHCAYHGWEFNGDGKCVKIPAHPDRPIPDFAHIKAYPVQEKAGLIWVYPQDASIAHPEELKVFTELLDNNYSLSPYETTWKAHLTRVVESVLDVAHLPFVHKNTIGRRVDAEIPALHFAVSDHNQISIQNGGGMLEYWFPQQWMLRPSVRSERSFINYVTFTPISATETMIFGYAGRTFLRSVPLINKFFSYYSLKILEEDRKVVESQHPRPIPEALRMEAHVPADGAQVRFRQRWYQFMTSSEAKVRT
jgi:phenylpropionate dioxygenase-like ring-hydroxylating dioxygenase large terminal subunit